MNSPSGQTSTSKLDSVGCEQPHAIHVSWRSEYALWHEELKLWQDEVKVARENLSEVLSSLVAHENKLKKHGASLTLYGQSALEHEHAMAEYQRGGNDTKLLALAMAQQAETERHAHLRDIHEQLKRLHHAIVARCSLLLKTVSDNCCCQKHTSQGRRIQ